MTPEGLEPSTFYDGEFVKGRTVRQPLRNRPVLGRFPAGTRKAAG